MLVSSEELIKLPQGSWMLMAADMQVWGNAEVLRIVDEVLPVATTRVIFTLVHGVSIDEAAKIFLKYNDENPWSQAKKILNNMGRVVLPLHKMRTAEARAHFPRDLPPETPEDIQIEMRGMDQANFSDFLEHFLQNAQKCRCEVLGVTNQDPMSQYTILRSGRDQEFMGVKFADINFARLFFIKFDNYHMTTNGRTIAVTLKNGSVFNSLVGCKQMALVLKRSHAVELCDLDALFRGRVGGPDDFVGTYRVLRDGLDHR